jgi:crotonobetainyl-CoA:carnitine CoA-transferase CaiB-like acyl-CoA transferase
MSALPLAGLWVLDLTAHRAGPTCVRQLADWGADVVKIEPPGAAKGDVVGGNRHGFDFQNLHRNKRGMTLNLKSPEAHAIFMKMAETADVIVENYRSDVKFRLKVDYETVAKVNPRIVYGSISGFGQTGPDATRPGVDRIAQGMGGLMSITGVPGQGLWERFCKAIGWEAALSNPDYANGGLRSKNRKQPNEEIGAITGMKPSAHWLKVINEAGVPCGPINDIAATFAEPQTQHLGIARTVHHPVLGDIKVVGQPIAMSDSPQPEALGPTPDLGQHTDAILGELGYNAAAIADLRARGVI